MATVASGGAGGSGGGGGGKKPRKIPSGPKWHTKKRRRLKKSEKKKKASDTDADAPGKLDSGVTKEQARQRMADEINGIEQMPSSHTKDGKIRANYNMMVAQGFIPDFELKTVTPFDRLFYTAELEMTHYKQGDQKERDRVEAAVEASFSEFMYNLEAENTQTMLGHLRDFVGGRTSNGDD